VSLHTIAVTMRRKPVTRSEIRFDRIATLPVDAVRIEVPDKDLPWNEYIVPIRKLWAPLLRELTEWRKRDVAKWQAAFGFPQKPPEPVSLAKRYFVDRMRGGVTIGTCKPASSIACTATIAIARTTVPKPPGVMAAQAALRPCSRRAPKPAQPPAPTAAAPTPNATSRSRAQRSTMKFCSVRCRVAAHREGKRDA
jgi:hypothetical protein